MLFNIHTEKEAQDTLKRLTSIPFSVWKGESAHFNEYMYCDDFLEATIKKYGTSLPRFDDIDFVISHITTSANACREIKENGLIDLGSVYKSPDSELRMFIERHGIEIRLDCNCLKYGNRYFDISFDNLPGLSDTEDTETYKAWLIGRRFNYDFCVNGFLQIDPKSIYPGYVHKRPEILQNIDDLLHLNLSKEWAQSHSTYEVIAKVSGRNLVCDSEQPTSDGKVIYYLCQAYNAAYGDRSTIVAILKNNIQIPARDILQINPFPFWG